MQIYSAYNLMTQVGSNVWFFVKFYKKQYLSIVLKKYITMFNI